MAEAHANFDNKTAFSSVEKSKPMTRIRGDRDELPRAGAVFFMAMLPRPLGLKAKGK
jgi:hypothetical protein